MTKSGFLFYNIVLVFHLLLKLKLSDIFFKWYLHANFLLATIYWVSSTTGYKNALTCHFSYVFNECGVDLPFESTPIWSSFAVVCL